MFDTELISAEISYKVFVSIISYPFKFYLKEVSICIMIFTEGNFLAETLVDLVGWLSVSYFFISDSKRFIPRRIASALSTISCLQ